MRRDNFLKLLCITLFIPVLIIGICTFALPPKYDATYMGELKYKYERLYCAQGKKIVLIGGSAAAFGVDSALLARSFPEYEVVNFGMYAALGSRMMLDLARRAVGEGDLVIFMPEINEQTLSSFTDGTYALQGLDGAWGMLMRIRPDLYPSLIGAMPAFSMEKLRFLLENTDPEPGQLYRRASFNTYGDMDNEQAALNIMPEEYDPDMPVYFDRELPTEEFTTYLNRYARSLRRKGASVYYHLCPVNAPAVNESAVNGDVVDIGSAQASGQSQTSAQSAARESAMLFYDHLKKILGFPVLGDPRDAVMEAGWFYDTNFHLNRAGRIVFTRQLIRDLKAVLGDTSVTNIEVPAMPRTLAFVQSLGGGDSGAVLMRSAYAGNTQITEITVPASVRRIEDRAFDGCTALRAIHLTASDPTGILVGRHLLDGTDAIIYVPRDALSAYRTDYRFSQYADRIKGEQD